MPLKDSTVATRYADLERLRDPVLRRGRDCALLTIPSLLPEETVSDADDLPMPYQALGARGVNNLAAKLLLALLPPSAKFFRLMMSDKVKLELKQVEGAQEGLTSKFEVALSMQEQSILKEIEARNIRASAFEAFKHLIVAGNSLLHFPKDGGMRVFPLSQYVIQRDPEGTVLEIVVKEVVAIDTLPDDVKSLVQSKLVSSSEDKADVGDPEREVAVYTRVRREGSGKSLKWIEYQEILDAKVPKSDGEYPDKKLPWVALRWTAVANSDYGRGHCEEYLGDLSTSDALEKNIVEAAAIMSSIKFLVDPNSGIDINALNKAPNGGFVEGDPEAVAALQAEKSADMTFVSSELQRIERRLSYAFLLNTAVQRDAERVTAEEIQYVAKELEDTLGGVYSVLASDFQLPLVRLVMASMVKSGKLADLPEGTVDTVVVTGLDALGRTRQLLALDQLMAGAVEKFGPTVLMYFNPSEYLARRAAALGIDPAGLIRSQEEVQQQQQQMAQQQMVESLGPQAIKAVSDNSVEAQRQQGQSNENR